MPFSFIKAKMSDMGQCCETRVDSSGDTFLDMRRGFESIWAFKLWANVAAAHSKR